MDIHKDNQKLDKQGVFDLLASKNIEFEKVEHPAVFHMGERDDIVLPHPEADAKNLFVRDDKKRSFFLITVRGEKRVDLRKFRKEQGLRPLSFGSPEELYAKLNLVPGSVSPFGLLSDSEREVKFFIDREFLEDPYLIGIHPNDNTATVFLKTEDLIDLIREHGTCVQIVDLPVRLPAED